MGRSKLYRPIVTTSPPDALPCACPAGAEAPGSVIHLIDPSPKKLYRSPETTSPPDRVPSDCQVCGEMLLAVAGAGVAAPGLSATAAAPRPSADALATAARFLLMF